MHGSVCRSAQTLRVEAAHNARFEHNAVQGRCRYGFRGQTCQRKRAERQLKRDVSAYATSSPYRFTKFSTMGLGRKSGRAMINTAFFLAACAIFLMSCVADLTAFGKNMNVVAVNCKKKRIRPSRVLAVGKSVTLPVRIFQFASDTVVPVSVLTAHCLESGSTVGGRKQTRKNVKWG